MPSILLINENKIVSRLLQLSSQKNGYNFEEVTKLDTSGDSYDVIFIDSESYSTELLDEINSKLNFNQIGYIGTKQDSTPDGFDLVIEKPFLPTDFVNLINEKVITGSQQVVEDTLDDSSLELDEIEDESNLELDTIEDSSIDELLSMDSETDSDLKELDSLDLDKDEDLSLDSSTIMTTGIAESMEELTNSEPSDLAEMVNEIEDMSDIDDGLKLDKELEPSIEVNEELLEEKVDDLSDDLSTEDGAITELDDKNISDRFEDIESSTVGAVAAAALGTTAVAMASSNKSDKESIDDIDTISERDIKNALDENDISLEDTIEDIVEEEIISQETIVDGEETVVESNDVEQWIRDAVTKAITPQMIKKALDDMEVTVTLNFKNKNIDIDSDS